MGEYILNSIEQQDATARMTGRVQGGVVSSFVKPLPFSETIEMNCNDGNFFTVEVNGDCTINAINIPPPSIGQFISLQLVQYNSVDALIRFGDGFIARNFSTGGVAGRRTLLFSTDGFHVVQLGLTPA